MTGEPKESASPHPGAAELKASADHLVRSSSAVKDSADRRTELASNRTVLAAERTYAAWVRTGLTALASGVGARALLAHVLPAWFGTITGTMLIMFSVFCFVAAVWREFKSGAAPPKPDIQTLPRGLLLGVNGFLIVVDIAAAGGVWGAK